MSRLGVGLVVGVLAATASADDGTRVPLGVSAESELLQRRDELVFACLHAGPLPAQIELVRGGTRRYTRFEATGDTPFARCFSAQLAELVARPRSFAHTLALPTLDELLGRALDASECSPRPGALPDSASIELGPTIRVTTAPANPEIDRCVEGYLRSRIASPVAFVQRANVAFVPRVSSNTITRTLLSSGIPAVTGCFAPRAPTQVTLRASASRGAEYVAITVDGVPAEVAACVRQTLAPALHARHSVKRVAAGRTERYFRVDSDIAASLAFAVMPRE